LFLNCLITELQDGARPPLRGPGDPTRGGRLTREVGRGGHTRGERHYLANQLFAAVQMYGSENVVSLERLQQ